jgi:hypothetical protein
MPSGRKRSYASRFSKKATPTFRRSKRKRFRRRKARTSYAKAFPKSMAVKLTYCDTIAIPNTDDGNAAYRFRLNSIFDPDMTGTGHQPRGHDQWATIYSKYCVVGAKVKVEPIYSSSSTGAGNTEVTIKGYIDDDITATNYSAEDIIELGMLGNKCQIVTIGQNAHGFERKVKPMTFKFGTKKFFGIKKSEQIINAVGIGQGEATSLTGMQHVGALFGTNPAKPAYLRLGCGGPTHDAQHPTVAARVTIEYSVIVHSPVEVASS